MEVIPKVGILLVVAAAISALVTFFTHGKKGMLLGFLVTLKNLLVGVLIASCMMMITLLAREDIAQIEMELNTAAREAHELGRYFMGGIVVAAWMGSLLSFFVTKIFAFLERMIGAIVEPKSKSKPGAGSDIVHGLFILLKAPFLLIANVILALLLSVLIASLAVLLELTVLGPLQITGTWEANIVFAAWSGAFVSYWVTRWVSTGRKKLEHAIETKEGGKEN